MAQDKRSESIAVVINLIVQFFVETFVGIAIGYFLGKYLDELLFDDQVILTYILVILGLFSGLWNLIKRVLRNIDGGKQNEKDEHH